MVRTLFWSFLVLVGGTAFALYYFLPSALWIFALAVAPFVLLGLYDVLQTRHAILRNFPVVGHGRYLLESIRPEINQYFIESDVDGLPVNREDRSLVYQRAKRQTDTLPFGTKKQLYSPGHEWILHSLEPVHVDPKSLRVKVQGPRCTQPYSLSVFNISAMSFGSLSKTAIEALNGGANAGGFAHNTGEGGVSPYHTSPGGDLIWQIGTGYFGCRDAHGNFDPDAFARTAKQDSVKMIELKLSQGAKPAHGGILPGAKVTPELAQIRGVKVGQTVFSPPSHSAFSGPIEMLAFVDRLRELCGGKPVGIKLCVGKRREFFALCKAMMESGSMPDFICVDGAEGGTGAAPLEFSNSVGSPLLDGLSFVHNTLRGCGLRREIRLLCSGRIMTGFDVIRAVALGADACMSARGMMFALGCIQALRCNSNACPAGVATQDPRLAVGLHVPSKAQRVASFHEKTVHSAAELLGAAGLGHLEELRPWHILRRVGPYESRSLDELFEQVEAGSILEDDLPNSWRLAWDAANAQSYTSNSPRPSRL